MGILVFLKFLQPSLLSFNYLSVPPKESKLGFKSMLEEKAEVWEKVLSS